MRVYSNVVLVVLINPLLIADVRGIISPVLRRERTLKLFVVNVSVSKSWATVLNEQINGILKLSSTTKLPVTWPVLIVREFN